LSVVIRIGIVGARRGVNVSCGIITTNVDTVAKLAMKVDWAANDFRWLRQESSGRSSTGYDGACTLQHECNHRNQHESAYGSVQT
jgi:hypothetical protein